MNLQTTVVRAGAPFCDDSRHNHATFNKLQKTTFFSVFSSASFINSCEYAASRRRASGCYLLRKSGYSRSKIGMASATVVRFIGPLI